MCVGVGVVLCVVLIHVAFFWWCEEDTAVDFRDV